MTQTTIKGYNTIDQMVIYTNTRNTEDECSLKSAAESLFDSLLADGHSLEQIEKSVETFAYNNIIREKPRAHAVDIEIVKSNRLMDLK